MTRKTYFKAEKGFDYSHIVALWKRPGKENAHKVT